MKTALASALLLCIALPAAAAEAEIPAGAAACDFGAWAAFSATAPIPVRSEPRADAPLLGTLPVAPVSDDAGGAVEFDVVEARPGTPGPGWLKIDRAIDPEMPDANGDPLPARPLPAMPGWIPADAAQIAVQSALGYARPDASGAPLLDLGNGDWLTDMGSIRAIRACAGPWLLLDYRILRRREPSGALIELPPEAARTGTAWFRGICANQVTTCDMRSVDGLP